MTPINREKVFISVGSNLGDKVDHCRFGIDRVAEHPQVDLLGISPFYRTAPVDYTAQDWFVNAAFCLTTTLGAHDLLTFTNTVQVEAGQGIKVIRFGPRILDLDIIFYGDRVVQTDALELPHPRMHKRRFVLQPICDIDPQFTHPVLDCSVQELLNSLHDDQQEVVLIDD